MYTDPGTIQYKSLTGTLMLKLGLRPSYSQKRNKWDSPCSASSPWTGISKLFPPRESLGKGMSLNFFYGVVVIFNMVWVYRLLSQWGGIYLFIWRLPSITAPRGEGCQHETVRNETILMYLNIPYCSTTGKPTHLFRTKCVSLDSV